MVGGRRGGWVFGDGDGIWGLELELGLGLGRYSRKESTR